MTWDCAAESPGTWYVSAIRVQVKANHRPISNKNNYSENNIQCAQATGCALDFPARSMKPTGKLAYLDPLVLYTVRVNGVNG